jgi:hypothetical protein
MNTRLLLLVLLFPTLSIAAPALWYEYSTSGVTKVVGVKGIVEITELQEGCAPDIIVGSIENITYIKGTSQSEGCNLRGTDGTVEYVDAQGISAFTNVEKEWVTRFVAPKRKVFVVAARCGASGRSVEAREIYDIRYIRALLK